MSVFSRRIGSECACTVVALALTFARTVWSAPDSPSSADPPAAAGGAAVESAQGPPPALPETGAESVEPPAPLPAPVPQTAKKVKPLTEPVVPPGGEAEAEPAGNVIVPLVMYTPETHVGVGAFYVHFFRLSGMKHSRVSSLAAIAMVTTREQMIFELHPDFYWARDAAHAFGKLEFQRYPDSFWGIGNKTRDSDEERYTRDRLRFRGGPNYRVTGSIYAGLGLDLMGYSATYSKPNGVFETQKIPGEAGGFTAGLGPVVSFDTRDNAVATRWGWLLNASLLWFPAPISRYDFRKVIIEARRFVQIHGEHIVGFRFYGETQGGEVPYYQLAMLGGDELLRGYYLGRWRDKNLAALETEYRFPLIWRFGGVAFAGAGEVADVITDLGSVPVKWAVGGGLRFSLNENERLNLRLDAGFGPDTYGLYFTAREAF